MSKTRALETRDRVRKLGNPRQVNKLSRQKQLAEIAKNLKDLKQNDNSRIDSIVNEIIALISIL